MYYLFDLDGTLTLPRQKISPIMKGLLGHLYNMGGVGIVTGSDLDYIHEQVGESPFDLFPCNGSVVDISHNINIVKIEKILLNTLDPIMPILSDIGIYGPQIVIRYSSINFAPIGRQANTYARDKFVTFDWMGAIRRKILQTIRPQLTELGWEVVLGGQTSFDIFPSGQDKRACLPFILHKYHQEEIVFVGDAIFEDGNDWAIAQTVKSFKVKNVDETLSLIKGFLDDSGM